MADTTVSFQFDACAPGVVSSGVAREEEARFIDGLRAGDEAAYETLIRRFEKPVFNMIGRLMDDPADTADVVQEVFLKIFRKVGYFSEESSLKTWIYRIAVNEARNHRRWFGRHRRNEVGIDPEPGEERGYEEYLADPGPSPFDTMLDRETQALIEEALGAMNPNFRAALVLREMEGLSYEEIAEILDVSLGTVKSRILRGRDALRKHLVGRLEPDWALNLSPQVAE